MKLLDRIKKKKEDIKNGKEERKTVKGFAVYMGTNKELAGRVRLKIREEHSRFSEKQFWFIYLGSLGKRAR